MANENDHVVVLVPGIMGSVLQRNGQTIWPGPVHSLLLPYRLMEELLDPDLQATDVIRSYWFSTQYGGLIHDLEKCGFHEKDGTLVVFPYDWRKPNERATELLADRLDKVVEERGTGLEVSLVAHSMGGLVSRFFLESGRFANRPGYSCVRRLITLATPHRGAPIALPRILGQEKVLWLSADQVRRLTNDPRYPSAYQLLPGPREPYFWSYSDQEAYAVRNLYDAPVASRLGLERASLEAAEAFQGRLAAQSPAHVRYFCFSGTQMPTASACWLREEDSAYRAEKAERDSAGDGTVPFWSSWLPGVQTLPVGGEHGVIYKNREVRVRLAALLGRPNRLGQVAKVGLPGTGRGVELDLQQKVVEPLDTIAIALRPEGGTVGLEGQLWFERADAEGVSEPTFHRVGNPITIRYSGPTADSLQLRVDAPAEVGAYRLAFYEQETPEPAAHDDLFVQQP
jgi:pimeloyl-ACP methyl ester carboxylesterase